ncbi:MAG: PD40 domain-containing protein [Steroidobacteraceae bacterium]|nr:PD40 domain-containing protein [Steroidobacteraceae bacterium]
MGTVPFFLLLVACAATPAGRHAIFTGEATRFAPGIVSTQFSDIRLTISPDGRTALWFSRNRPGGAGGYDIWVARRAGDRWNSAEPAPFNTDSRDFDPAFSADGLHIYFCSDRAGGAGGDDLYRVSFTNDTFGLVESLGAAVNSVGNEWAPMLSPDGRTLLFSSDRYGGAGRMDLYFAGVSGNSFTRASAAPGAINTAEDEFDATFLDDGATIVFTRAPDLRKDDVRLFEARGTRAGYDRGTVLPANVNTPGGDAYAPMLDWSRKARLTFTTRRPIDSPDGVDVYLIEYEWE